MKARLFIPNRSVRINKNEPAWITSEIKRKIRKRRKLFRKAKQTNLPTDWDRFKTARNNVIDLIKAAKRKQIDNVTYKLLHNRTSKSWWETIKKLIKPNCSKATIPPLHSNNSVIFDKIDKAKCFNKYFTDQTKLDDSQVADPTPPYYRLISTLESIQVNQTDVAQILKALPMGKAVGPDLLNNRILKEVAEYIAKPLSDIFNTSLRTGVFPETWKLANVCPIHKKDDPALVSNYRPISLLCSVSKVFEKLVYKHIFNHMLNNNILSPYQSGFIPSDSTTGQLAYLYHRFCEAIDSGKEVRVVFCDVSKAFDRVWHRGLLIKLKSIGVRGKLFDWFANYLTDRKQQVQIENISSDMLSVDAGVPQGSILGPLLFLVYINDIVRNIQANIRLFADDTSLSILVNSPNEAANILNNDLNTISLWANTWLVSFNPIKTKNMIVSKKVNETNHPPLYFNGHVIDTTHEHKHLGITLSNDCSWHNHIEIIKSKAWKRINIMRKLKWFLDRKSLEMLYFSFIRPLMEYGDILFDNSSINDKTQLENIQLEAARIVTGTTKLVPLRLLYKETGWQTLEYRRHKHKLINFYKIKNLQYCPYLFPLIPSRGNNRPYNLRNANTIPTYQCRTTLFFNSYFPSITRAWNNLTPELQTASSLFSFKRLLDLDKPPKPPDYF